MIRNFRSWEKEERKRQQALGQMRSIMMQLQGNPVVDFFRSLKYNFKEGRNANRIAMAMLSRLMQRMLNIEKIRAIREWTSGCQKAKLLSAMQQESVSG